jgi:hypothetical protein
MDFIQIFTGRFLLNYIGGTLRFIYGITWRTIFNKPKFTYKEYIYGSKKKNYYDKNGHEFNNRMIAFIFIMIIISLAFL